MRVMPSTNK